MSRYVLAAPVDSTEEIAEIFVKRSRFVVVTGSPDTQNQLAAAAIVAAVDMLHFAGRFVRRWNIYSAKGRCVRVPQGLPQPGRLHSLLAAVRRSFEQEKSR